MNHLQAFMPSLRHLQHLFAHDRLALPHPILAFFASGLSSQSCAAMHV